MAEYHLTPEAIQVGQKALLKRAILLAVIMLAAGLGYTYGVLHADSIVLLFMVVLSVGTSLYSYFYNLKQQKLAVESYRLVIAPDSISRFSAIVPPLHLSAAEITSITQHAQGELAIVTADKYRAIYVPAQIINRPELLHELTQFAPLTTLVHKTWTEKLIPFVSIGVAGLMALFYSVNDRVVSTITGLLLLGILSWSYWHIWRNKNLPKQSRRLLWFMPLILFSIIAGIVARLLQ